MNRAIVALAKLLEPGEREYVCGDIQELGLSAPRTAANILGLVIRKQLAEWTHWGPWIALIGVAGLAGCNLSESVGRVQSFLHVQITTYLKYGVAYESGGVSPEQQIVCTATATAALLFVVLGLWICACLNFGAGALAYFFRLLLRYSK